MGSNICRASSLIEPVAACQLPATLAIRLVRAISLQELARQTPRVSVDDLTGKKELCPIYDAGSVTEEPLPESAYSVTEHLGDVSRSYMMPSVTVLLVKISMR